MEIFALPEVASRILLFTNLDSLLELRSVNKQLFLFVSEFTPLLCERDCLPVKEKFFHWALMHSQKNKTRYSKLFPKDPPRRNEAKQAALTQLGQLLEKGDFQSAYSLITPDLLCADTFNKFFVKFSDNDECIEWMKEYLKVMDNDQRELFLAALRCKNPCKMIARMWSKEMSQKLSKDKVFEFIGKEGTLDLFYAIDQLYPNLHELEQSLASPPESWIFEYVKKDTRKANVLLSLALKKDDIYRCDYLFSLGLRPSSNTMNYCKTLQSLYWLCDRISINREPDRYAYFEVDWNEISLDKLLRHLIKIKCTGEELESFLIRYEIKNTYSHQIFYTDTFSQFEVLLKRLTGPWYTNGLRIGDLLLLQYYDPERFSLPLLLESGQGSVETIRFVLERNPKELDWDKLVEVHLYNKAYNNGEILSLLLEKDMQINDFTQGLPERWKYSAKKQ